MKLTTIVPRIPPIVDGIGDYALCLARMLRDNLGITTRFIVGDPAWKSTNEVEGFEVRRMSSHSSNELLNLLEGDSDAEAHVLLHYEGYGYANRGCPFWLVDATEQWRCGGNKRTLLTLFHELYATGPPWTSSFWLSVLQKNLAARLTRLSDHRMTSCESYARIVRKMSGNGSPASSLPVFSSIGEAQSPPPLAARRRRLITFGTRGRRIEVYRRSAAELTRLCVALGIEEIADIGRSIDLELSGVVKVPVITCGELSGSEVSELLADSVAGVIDYPAAMLAKSTIFAAYCSNRMIPIVANNGDARAADGLEVGTHYWLSTAPSKQVNIASGQLIADSAFDWYQSHNLAAHSRTLAALLTPTKVAAPCNVG